MKSNIERTGKSSIGKKISRAQFSGNLIVGDAELPCYVLEDGRRLFSTTGMLTSLGYKSNANAGEIFNSRALLPHMKAQNSPYGRKQVVEFDTPLGIRARGYDVEKFMDICHALSEAYESGELSGRNEKAAKQANVIIRACSKIGIVALVDEATGYQYIRPEDALQFKLKLYLAEEMRAWEKTFPDALWEEFARLTNHPGEYKKNRPRFWGYLVMEYVYRHLDSDVAKYIKENKPKPRKGRNYHQWFNEDYGVRKLTEHIHQVIGVAKACDNLEEFKKRMRHAYKGEPIQLEIFMNKELENNEKPMKLRGDFDGNMRIIVGAKPPKIDNL